MADLAEALDTLEHADPFAEHRNQLRALAHKAGEYAGLPIQLAGGPYLQIEPSHRAAAMYAQLRKDDQGPDPGEKNLKLRGAFYSHHMRSDVLVIEENGRVGHGLRPRVHNLDQQLATLMASDVWGFEQEATAVHLLGNMITHRQFRQYMMTGAFLESSKRSGIAYMFRRLRPTVALAMRGTGFKSLPGTRRPIGGDRVHILASLCLHPIGYYEGSWAGAMCPTDDVIAHLTLMRADEHLFWRRANQHSPHAPEAGL